ncbi:tandem-95 repeat protein [Wenzhouxiangella sp. EGI_FJ10409]|uniref:tandem-95 repeat protein n=1 Tax=Wenzhouxiangella sp. EGI_FJ10409 TaxID=3243767 RepID=UPI0035D6EA6E
MNAVDPVSGVVARLRASVDPATAQVDALTLERCEGGSFGAPQTLNGGYPVGLNNGEGGADVVELAVHAAQLGSGSAQYSFTMMADDGSSVDQAAGGGLGITVPVPLAPWAMLLLAVALLAIALWALSRHRGPTALLLGLLAVTAWAAHFMLDGEVADWAGVSPIIDPAGDTTAGGNRADILAVFTAQEDGRLWFRVDLADIENAAPTAADDIFTTDEDTVLTGENVLADNGAGPDSDPDGDTLAVTGFDATSAEGAAVNIAANGDLDYDPTGVAALQALAVGESQDDTFTYTIEDPDGSADTATVTVTVDGVNDAPTASDDAFATDENTPITTTSVLANDTDPDTSDTLSLDSIDTTATAGVVTDNGDGTFDYDPNGQFDSLGDGDSDTDTFDYTVTDSNGGTDTATVTITITGINTAPVASDDAFATDEDSALTTGDVLANDSDAEGDTLSVDSIDTIGTQGSVTDNGDGSFGYDPNGQFEALAQGDSDTDSFTYTVSDGNGGTDTATVTITINGVNDAPTANDDAYMTDEDIELVVPVPGVLGNDDDVDTGDTLTAVLDADVSNGALNLNADGSFSYTPAADFNGTDSFTYHANDGSADSATVTVTITVNAVNDAPSFTAGNPPAVDEDAGAQTVNGWVTSFDPGPNEGGQSVLAYTVSNVSNGALFSTGPTVDTAGNLSYTPAADAFGTSEFDVAVQDDGGTANGGTDTSPVQTFTITVNPVDDPPVAVDDATTLTEDDPATTIDVLANDTDIDGGPISVTGVTQPANGSVAITNAGADLTYEPDPDYCNDGSPTDEFAYTLNGGSTATVAVTVTCVNDAPNVVFPTAGANFDISTGPVNLDPAGTLTDVDSNQFSRVETTLDIGGPCDPSDTLTVEDQGTGAGQIGFDGTTVSFEGTPISTSVEPWACVDPGFGAQIPFTIELGTNADQAATEALLRALQFSSTSADDATRSAESAVTDDGGATGSAVQTINFDEAPEASSSVDNETNLDPSAGVTVDFSENVDIDAGAFTFECDSTPVAFTTSPPLPATGIATINLIPDSDLTPGAVCTVTVLAANVRDSDTIDPPDNMVADAVFGFVVEAPPQVDALSPADGSSSVEPGANVVIGFDEPVNLNGNWFTLQCGATTFSPGNGNVNVTSNDVSNTQVTLDPDTDFGFGSNCVLDIFADVSNGVNDQDSADGPGLDTLDGNGDGVGGDDFTASFDVEAAPEVIATTPADSATDIAGNTDVVIDFSEPVTAGAGAFVLECPGTISLTASANVDQDQYTLTPGTDLPGGETCTVTVVAAEISDVDSIDPPDNPDADFVFSFTIDEAPVLDSVQAEVGNTLTTVIDGTTLGNVDEDTTIALGFSEPVNVTNDGVSLICTDSGTVATPTDLAIGGDGTATITLTRASGTFSSGETCELGFNVTEINDADANDPPDNLEPVTGTFAFEITPVVNDDARTVTAQLEAAYTDGSAGGNDDHLLVNDDCTGCTLTFGESDASVNNAGDTATFSDGAIVTVNNDGSFTYNPPPGVTGTTDTFVYRLTTPAGSFDEATVTMTIDGPVIWYVDADATGPVYNGTAAFPFDDLAVSGNGFDGSPGDVAGATVFVYDSASDNSSVQCGLTLLDNQTVIGEGEAAGTLDALTGRSPVAETVLAPDTTGAHPQLASSGDCLTLGSGNTVRGLDIGDTTSGYAFADGGATIGTATITDVGVNGTGGILSIVNGGTLNASFNETSATSAPDTEIELVNVGGTLDSASGSVAHSDAGSGTISISGGNIGGTVAASFNQTAGNGPLLRVHGGHTGSLTFSGAMTASAGTGLQFDNADGTYNLSGQAQISGGDAGVNVVNGSGGTLNITNAGSLIEGIQGVPFRVNSSTMNIDYDGGIAHTLDAGSLLSSRTVEIIGGTGTISLDGLVLAGSNQPQGQATAEVLYLQATGATNPVSFNYVDATTRDTATAKGLTSGNIAIDRLRVRCDGNLTVGGDTHCLDFSDVTSNGVTVEALAAVLNNAGGLGGAISLVNTPGVWTVEDISGGLFSRFENAIFGNNFGTLNLATVNSATSPGGVATGTVWSDEAAAVDLENGTINIQIGNLQAFNSVTGLRLVNTNGPGLEVLDGQIPNTTGDSVELTDTGNIILNSIEISGSALNGIRGQNVTNFTLSNSLVTNNGNPIEGIGLLFDNLLGTATISNTTISGSTTHNVKIDNDTGTLADLVIEDSIIRDTPVGTGANGVLLQAIGTASMGTTVINSSFIANKSNGIQADAGGTSGSSVRVDVDNSTFTGAGNSDPTDPAAQNAGVNVSTSSSGSASFSITNSTFTGHRAIGINFFANASTSAATTVTGSILGNTIGTQGVANSGSAIGNGIDISNEGANRIDVLIDNNTVQGVGDGAGNGFEGIFINDIVNAGRMNATVTNNIIRDIFDDRGLVIQERVGGTHCSDVSGNTFSNIGGISDMRVRQTSGTHNVVQADPSGAAPNLSTVNGNASVTVSGVISFGVGSACPTP